MQQTDPFLSEKTTAKRSPGAIPARSLTSFGSTIDARGQMVLPKELRERAEITPGDRFAVVFSERKGSVCCITLIKKDHLDSYITSLVHPEQQECGTKDQKTKRS